MLRKLVIILVSVFFLVFNAYAGSDGDLVLNKDRPEKIKDCFEK